MVLNHPQLHVRRLCPLRLLPWLPVDCCIGTSLHTPSKKLDNPKYKGLEALRVCYSDHEEENDQTLGFSVNTRQEALHQKAMTHLARPHSAASVHNVHLAHRVRTSAASFEDLWVKESTSEPRML